MSTHKKRLKKYFLRLKHIWLAFLHNENLKQKIYSILFESNTRGGKIFDVFLILFILSSVTIVIAKSVKPFPPAHDTFFLALEWIFTIFFTIEYLMRLYSSKKPRKYVFSFLGIIDLLSTLPTYLGFFNPGFHRLLVIRVFRLLRLPSIFHKSDLVSEGNALLLSLKESSKKIIIFFFFVLLLVIFIGTIMYMIEGDSEETKFKNIPSSIYWAVVTLTTVGYGDITPVTTSGRFLSAIVMLLGYTIIAVPTGIVSVSMIKHHRRKSAVPCPNCNKAGHEENATYCKHCGNKLENGNEDLKEET